MLMPTMAAKSKDAQDGAPAAPPCRDAKQEQSGDGDTSAEGEEFIQRTGKAPLVAAVLLIVIVAVALPLVTLTVGGIEHVGEFVAPDGLEVRGHVRLTVPVKPPDGVTEMVVVLPVVCTRCGAG